MNYTSAANPRVPAMSSLMRLTICKLCQGRCLGRSMILQQVQAPTQQMTCLQQLIICLPCGIVPWLQVRQAQPVRHHPATAAEDLLAPQDGALDAVLARNRRSQWAPAKQGGGPPKAKGHKGGGKGMGGRGGGPKRKAAQGGKPAVKSLKVGACPVSMLLPVERELEAGSRVRQRLAACCWHVAEL